MSQSVSLFSLSSSGSTPPQYAWTFTNQDLVTTIDRLYRICELSQDLNQTKDVINQLARSLGEFESLRQKIESKHSDQNPTKLLKNQSQDINGSSSTGLSSNSTQGNKSNGAGIVPIVNCWMNGNPLTSPVASTQQLQQHSSPILNQKSSPQISVSYHGEAWENTKSRRRTLQNATSISQNHGNKKLRTLSSQNLRRNTQAPQGFHAHNSPLQVAQSNQNVNNSSDYLSPQRKTTKTAWDEKPLPVTDTLKNLNSPAGKKINIVFPPSPHTSQKSNSEHEHENENEQEQSEDYDSTQEDSELQESLDFQTSDYHTEDLNEENDQYEEANNDASSNDLVVEDIDFSLMSSANLLSYIESYGSGEFAKTGKSWYEISEFPSPNKKEIDTLQDRLTSPSRSIVSQQIIEEKQEKAKLYREQQHELRREGARKSTERVRAAMQRREEKQQQLLKATEEKHKKAEVNARLYMESISESARSENQKVDEFKLYNQLKQDTLVEKTNSKLQTSESRRKLQIQNKIEKLEKEKIKEKEAKEKRDKLQEHKQKILLEKESTRKAAEARREVIEKKEQENIIQRNAEKMAKVQETNKKQQILQEQKKKIYLEKLENSEKRKSEQIQNIKAKALTVNERVKEVKTRKVTNDQIDIEDNAQKQRKITNTKRIKKLKSRLAKLKQQAETSIQLQDESKILPTLKRMLQDLKQQIHMKRHVEVTSLILELFRILDGKPEEIDNLRFEGIFDILFQVIQNNGQKFPVVAASKLLARICASTENVTYLVATLQILPIINLLRDSLIDTQSELNANLLSVFVSVIRLTHIPDQKEIEKEMVRDLISMFSALDGFKEILHSISRYIQNSQFGLTGTINPMIHKAAYFLQCVTEFIVSLRERDNVPIYEKQIIALGPEEGIVSELSDIVPNLMSVMAHLLLKQGPSRGESFQQSISPSILNFCLAVFKFLNHYANISYRGFQKHMKDAETFSSKHVLSFLLEYCNRDVDIKPGITPESDDPTHSSTKTDIEMRLINELVLFAGYFALDNEENQKILQSASGKGNIIQLLCQLPIQYFADEGFKSILIPTLISVTYKCADNVAILSQEMSLETLISSLESYMQSVEETSDIIDQPRPNLRNAYLPKNRIFISQEAIDFYKKFIS